MYRERAAGMYSELPFASAQCLIEVPYNLVQAFLFSLISYFMLGFDHDAGESSSLLFVLCSLRETPDQFPAVLLCLGRAEERVLAAAHAVSCPCLQTFRV